MAKPEQVLIIEPQNELRFKGPFTSGPITSYIKLTNPTKKTVVFKIKTTAPRRYCVRPNCGYLKPEAVTQVAVSLQSQEFDPSEKNKHKFMVQTFIPPDDFNEDYSNDVWKYVPQDQLMDSKLKCVFENYATTVTSTETTTTSTVTNAEMKDSSAKSKDDGDSLKSPSKVEVIDETDEKLLKAAQEVNQLRVEQSNLRLENLQLREDLLKMKKALDNEPSLMSGSGLTLPSGSQFSPTSTSVLIAIAMVIVGFLLGKLF